MSSKYNTYQVICIGEDCKAYDVCKGKECILESKYKKWIQGCNYSNIGDCEYCSHRKNCYLIKPYSDEIHEIEVKLRTVEKKNEKLWEYISNWDEVEKELRVKGGKSVTDVVYFKRTKQQMARSIAKNKELIEAYREDLEELLQ